MIQHAEDHDLTAGADMHEGAVSARLGLRGWPRIAEDVIIARDVLIAEYARARYHAAHLDARAVRILARRSHETSPHCRGDAAPPAPDGRSGPRLRHGCKVNPPFASPRMDPCSSLADGTIDAIATDHAPHPPGKRLRVFGGLAGWSGSSSLRSFAAWSGKVASRCPGCWTRYPRGRAHHRHRAAQPARRARAEVTLVDRARASESKT